jgi:hypothetical protein
MHLHYFSQVNLSAIFNFSMNLGCIEYNVPAVYDVLPPDKAMRSIAGRQKCVRSERGSRRRPSERSTKPL